MSDNDNLFEQPVEETTDAGKETNLLENWVGEGKKYKTVQDFASSFSYAQEHIKRLEEENRKYRESLENYASGTEEEEQGEYEDNRNNSPFDENVLKNAYTKFQKEEQMQANIKKVNDELYGLYGEKAAETLQNRAKELGLGIEKLKEMAMLSPQACLTLINPTAPRTNRNPNITGGINTEVLGLGDKVRDAKFWSEMRKKDPNAYYSPQMTGQRHQDAAKLGSRYFQK